MKITLTPIIVAQFLLFLNLVSDRKDLKNGVPQGSVLGPTLLQIYVDSLFQLNCSGNIIECTLYEFKRLKDCLTIYRKSCKNNG